MKVKLFNNGKGWYVAAKNYRDEKDKAYMNVHFAKCEEPQGNQIDIVIDEARFGAYQGKIQLTVFHYSTVDNSNFGGDRAGIEQSVNIDKEDLPFF